MTASGATKGNEAVGREATTSSSADCRMMIRWRRRATDSLYAQLGNDDVFGDP